MTETVGSGSFDCGTCGRSFEGKVFRDHTGGLRTGCPHCGTSARALGYTTEEE